MTTQRRHITQQQHPERHARYIGFIARTQIRYVRKLG
jgi:hypothetical protein